MGMKITRDIFQVGGGSFTAFEDGAMYLIHFGDRAALVDAGCGHSTDKMFINIQECGVHPEQVVYLLITHCHFDHTGGAQAVRERTGCQIVAHELDARFLEEANDTVTAAKWYGASLHPLPVDIKLKDDRQSISLGDRSIEAVHVPGHSPGSVVYVTESEGQKILFGQDVHGPLDASLLSDEAAYRRSLNLLLSLQADILCEGHYGIFRGRKAVADFIASFL